MDCIIVTALDASLAGVISPIPRRVWLLTEIVRASVYDTFELPWFLTTKNESSGR